MIQPVAIYVLWLREMIKFFRAKIRIIGAIAMPVFMLVFMGLGFRKVDIPGLPPSIGYFQYFVPGIIGMTLLFTGVMVGMMVLIDRQFGFLKEIMVTPASRVSIVLGRIAGGTTTSFIQALIILILSVFMGFQVSGIIPLCASLVIMLLISIIFISAGLILASWLKDPHDFNNITTFLLFPIFLLSGALFPLENLPAPIRVLAFADPLTYGVDAMRGFLIGTSVFPLYLDCILLVILSLAMILMAAYAFKKGDAI